MTKYEPPKETATDRGAALATRGTLGAIRVIGQFAIELYETVITPAIDRRKAEWMNEVAEGLRRLEIDVDALKDNESFVDTVLQASQAAVRTAQKEKRQALRNAVFNAALPDAPDQTQQLIFIQFIDGFTSLHIQLLSLLDDPEVWFQRRGREAPKRLPKVLWELVTTAFPYLVTRDALCERVCAELHDKGLLIADSLRKSVTRFPYFPDRPREEQTGYKFSDELPSDLSAVYCGNPTSMRHWTTELGREFLAFASSPED